MDEGGATAVLDHLTDRVVVTDRRGRVLRCNRVQSGSQPEVLADLLSLEIAKELERALPMATDEEQRLELVEDQGHRERHLEARLRAGPEDDQVTIVLRDVSDSVERSTARLRRLDQQARAEALLEVAYVASHDLKAPLRHIKSLAEWLAEDAGDALDGDARGTLELLRSNVVKMDELLGALLDYARAGNTEAEVEPLDLRACILEVIDMLPTEGFTIEVAEGMPTIPTARSPFERVILNLVANAVKHHDADRGTIVVAGQPRGDHYEITVADDGPGIPEGKLVEAFQMFKKLGRSEGSGMGLALVKKIAEGAGGRISVEANDPRGCCFRLLWPMHWGDAHPERTERPPASRSVLVVDDSSLARELTRRMLTRRGFEVVEASNVERALAIIADLPVDVVLTDLRMPGQGGFSLIERLARERPSLPVLVLTSEPGDEHVDRAKQIGAAGYVVKPVKGSALAAAIRAALEASTTD